MNRRDKLKSSLGSLLRALWDLMILNILWIVCCVPVVTFGPTSSALSRALIRMVQGESTSAVRDFFLSFRRDFGKAVVLGMIGLLGLAVYGALCWLLGDREALRTMFKRVRKGRD